MYRYLDDAILEGLILEAAIATPYNVEENIKRGRMTMQHVISSHKYEPRAMYRKDMGWIGFEWGFPGNPPPNFKNKEKALNWWNTLKNKYTLFKKGYGVSHIIAKRDWEGEFIKEFIGQKGVDVAFKMVEVIARGKPGEEGIYKTLVHNGYRALFRRPPERYKDEKLDEEWLLTGYKIETAGYEFIFESADDMVVSSAPIKLQAQALYRCAITTNPPPFGPRQRMGAANSSEIINRYSESVNTGWLYDL